MHSLVGADETSPNEPYSIVPESRRKSEAEPVTTVQANRLNVRQIEGGGIGYGRGYTTLETFLTPTYNFDTWLPFLDLRVHRFDNNKYAFNTGLGFRYFTPSNCMIWGLNAYYDYRQAQHKHFKQIGVGVEALGAQWDFRINGYIPVGSRKSHIYQIKFDEFEGHRLYVKAKREFDFGGANAEAAYHWMANDNIDITAALGPYYFRGEFNRYAAGGQARLKATFINAISIEGITSYDNLFKWKGQGQLTFSIPLGPKVKTCGIRRSRCCDRPSLDLRLVNPVERFEIIVADSHHQREVAINPLTGQPFNFVFVNNDPSSTPDGSYENPFLTLTDAQAGSAPSDVVYVYGGGPVYTVGNNGFAMQNNQKLWGSGINQLLQTSLGKVTVPAMTNAYPAVDNDTPGTVATNQIVLLANNTEVSGLYLPDVDAEVGGIVGASINNALVKNNILILNTNTVVAGVNGLRFKDCGGIITARNNSITDIVGTTLGSTFGIAVGTSGTNLNPTPCSFIFANNTLTGTGAIVTGNRGINASQTHGAVYSFVIKNNNISSWGDSGVVVQPTNCPMTSVQITGNTFVNNKTFAAAIQFGAASGPGEIDFTITNNNFLNNGPVGNTINILAGSSSGGATVNGLIGGNLFQGNTPRGSAPNNDNVVLLGSATSNLINVQVNKNIFRGNNNIASGSNVFVTTVTGASAIVQVNNNVFSGNTLGTSGSLVGFFNNGTGFINAQVDNNLFQGTIGTGNDVKALLQNGDLCLQLNNNTFDAPCDLSSTAVDFMLLEEPTGNTGAVNIQTASVDVVAPGTCGL